MLRPSFDPDEASRVARNAFGLEGRASPFPSDRDQNFRLATEGGEFLLKLSNLGEEREALDLQNAALAHLERAGTGYIFPRVRSSLSGDLIAPVADRTGNVFLARMLTWVEGTPLAEVSPHSAGLLRGLGRFLGRLDAALMDFSHPAANRALVWDLKHGARVVRERQVDLPSAEDRSLIATALGLFGERVSPLLPELRTSVIHGDGNDWNLLVGPVQWTRQGTAEREVVGIVDFGDMVRSYTVAELAVAAAYVMMGKQDPLEAAAELVSGFHSTLPLTATEIESLYALIWLRLAVSVCMSAHHRAKEPANEYLTISEKPAWDLLRRLSETDPDFAHYRFRDACGLRPCPASGALVSWLKQHREDFLPVVEPDPRTVPTHTFDLGIGSQELASVPETDDPRLWTGFLFGRMSTLGAVAGIGKYDEYRRWNRGQVFEAEGNERTELRSLHLGVDLFLEVGTPVLAPLEGRIHSFRDNRGILDYGPTIILEHETGRSGAPFYTLYGHLSPDSLEGLERHQPVRKGEQIGRIGSFPANGNWAPHLHFQVMLHLLGHEGEFPGVARPSQRRVWLDLCPDPGLILDLPVSQEPPSELEPDLLAEARRRRIGPNLSLSYGRPLKIVRGWMQHLFDHTGQPYLDMVNNVAHVGHSHPRVVEAIQSQVAVLNTNTRYLHDHLVRYAERLVATLPEPLSVCFFVCSGSEANELALRMARAHTGRNDVVVVEGAYHGNTTSLVGISPYKFDGPGGEGPPPHVHTVPMPDPYRGLYRDHAPDLGPRYAEHVRRAVEEAGKRASGVAAFFCESVLSCGGQIVLPEAYLREAYRHVRAAGGVCVADEVQVGFGRVGSHFWGFETQDVIPDIVTMGKPMGNGHPLGAVVTTREIAASFDTGMEYFNTFGGNPVSCAAGLAVLEAVGDEGLQEHALEVGSGLLEGLRRLMPRHLMIGDVRGLGLFLGVELVLDREERSPAGRHASHLVERMKDAGILLSTDGPDHNVVKMKPPLVLTVADADRVVATMDRILHEDAFGGG
jgi:4-aminobutyrate aminotransferase-like enzyme/Ser/Thr protein kinase RdoA (MazF antagonist)